LATKRKVLLSNDFLGRFYDLARLDASGARLDPAVAARGQLNADRLQIRIEPTAGLVVSVGNIVPELWPFAADLASFCHK
jgi:hypothetical protein